MLGANCLTCNNWTMHCCRIKRSGFRTSCASKSLSGVRKDVTLRKITTNLNALRRVAARDDHWDQAAALYRTCRRSGVTIRSVVDCLIARLAIRDDALLLAHDRDFAMMVPHCGLRLA